MANLRMTRQHRGLRSYIWTHQHAFQLVALLALWWLVLWFAHEPIADIWSQVLSWAWPYLGLGSGDAVRHTEVHTMGIPITVIRTSFFAPAPSLWQWWLGLVTS